MHIRWIPAALFGLLATGPSAYAREYTTIELTSRTVDIAPGDAHTFDLDGWRFIKKLVIDAAGVRNDAMFEVIVNEEVKGTIYVPGADPQYVVTVGESSDSIEFRHLSGASARIFSVTAHVSRSSLPGIGPGLPLGPRDKAIAADLANLFISTVADLEVYASAADFEDYLLPIKIAAGRAYASARASGDLSQRVRDRLVVLVQQVRAADAYIDAALADDDTFALAVDLLTLKEALEDLLE